MTAASALVLGWVVLGCSAAVAHRPRRGRRLPGAHASSSAASPSRGRRNAEVGAPQPTAAVDPPPVISVLLGVALALIDPKVAAASAVVVVLWRRHRRRLREERFELEVMRELPDTIDLLRLSLGAGGSVVLAVRGVASRPIGPISHALAAACARMDRGQRAAEALEAVVDEVGEQVRPLVRALTSAEHYGTPLSPTLERLADESRAARRRRAQAEARRVPVRLLLPLVLCILPAFVLLTLVPTLARTLQELRFDA